MIFCASSVHSKSSTLALLLFLWIIGSQIWRYYTPGKSFVKRFMYKLAPKVKGACIKGIYINCTIPVKSQDNLRILMSWFYRVVISCLMVIPTYKALLAHTPSITAIFFIWNHIKTITKAYFLPVAISNALVFPNVSRTSPTTIILHTSIYIVWKLIIYIDVIELCYRYITDKAPSFSSIPGNIHAAIITIYHKISVGGMNPPSMMVWMYSVINPIGWHELFKVFSTVLAHVNISKYRIYSVFILRIYKNITVVKGPVTNIFFVIGFGPSKSCISTFVKCIFFGLYQCIYDVWFVGCYGKTDTS